MKSLSSLALLASLSLALISGCASSKTNSTAGHEGHQLVQDEKGQWTCSHCGGDYDGPGQCKNSYCKMDLVRKEKK
jgi:hypothetical protein